MREARRAPHIDTAAPARHLGGMKRTVLASLSCLLLAGCFPITKEALRQEASARDSFEIAEDYQTVYRRLVPLVRQCMEGAWIGDNVVARTDLYTDIRKAEIVIEGVNALMPRRVMVLIELDGSRPGRTRVKTFEPIRTRPSPELHKWATGELKDCG